jgi:hypothetical protein
MLISSWNHWRRISWTQKTLNLTFDKKYVKTKEREQHLPDYVCRQCWSRQSSGNLSTFIVICMLQRCPQTWSGRCCSLSFVLTFFLSFHLSELSFYNNINLTFGSGLLISSCYGLMAMILFSFSSSVSTVGILFDLSGPSPFPMSPSLILT